jgi:hypothetical protein
MFRKISNKIIIFIIGLVLLFCLFYNDDEKFSVDFKKPEYINGICYQTSFSTFPNPNPNLNTEIETDQFRSDIAYDRNWDKMRERDDFKKFFVNNNINCVKIYNATLDYSHNTFFKDLEDNKLQVMYPISNYWCFGTDDANLKRCLNLMIREIRQGNGYRDAIHSIAFNNEGDHRAADDSAGKYKNSPNKSQSNWAHRIIAVINIFIQIEKDLNIDSNIDIVIPLTYGDPDNDKEHSQYKYLANLIDNESWKDRYVLGINSFNRASFIIDEMDNHVQYNKPFYLTEFSPGPNHNSNSDDFTEDLKTLYKYHIEKKKLKGTFPFSFLSQVTKEGAEKYYDITRYASSEYNVEKCESANNCPPQNAEIIDYNNKFKGIRDGFNSYTIPTKENEVKTEKYECNNNKCVRSSTGTYNSLTDCESNCEQIKPDTGTTPCTNKNGDTINVDFSTNVCGNVLSDGLKYMCYIDGDKTCGGQKTINECQDNNFHWCGTNSQHDFSIKVEENN